MAVLSLLHTAILLTAARALIALHWHLSGGMFFVLILVVGTGAFRVSLALRAAMIDQWREWARVLVFVPLVGGAVYVFAWVETADQLAMHERGIAVNGMVTRQWEDDGGLAPVQHITVMLDDGRTVNDPDFPGQSPRKGAAVTITLDPRGEVKARLGGPPDRPSGTLRTVGLVVFCVSEVGLGAASVASALSFRRSGSDGGRE